MRLLCATLLMLAMLVGCEDGKTAKDTPPQEAASPEAPEKVVLAPRQVVRQMLQAARDGDELKFWSFFTQQIREQKDAAERALGKPHRMFQVLTETWTEQVTLTVGEEKIEGDTAHVPISGDKETQSFVLIKEKGAWRYAGEITRKGARNDFAKQIESLVERLKQPAPKKKQGGK